MRENKIRRDKRIKWECGGDINLKWKLTLIHKTQCLLYLLHYYRNLTCCLPTWIPNIKDSFYEFSENVLQRSVNAKFQSVLKKILYFISSMDTWKKRKNIWHLKRIHYRYILSFSQLKTDMNERCNFEIF